MKFISISVIKFFCLTYRIYPKIQYLKCVKALSIRCRHILLGDFWKNHFYCAAGRV